ncbi:MAG: hypothetical protein ACOC2C_07215, partial [Cyclonatronaceae bacterium]
MNIEYINEYITGYVDGELSENEERTLMEQARKDERIYKAIESERRLKQMVRSKLHRKQAPESLKRNISELLHTEYKGSAGATSGHMENEPLNADYPSPSRNRFLLSLAAVLSIGLLITIALRFVSDETSVPPETALATSVSEVEVVSQAHYAKHSGAQLPESFEARSTAEAEQELKNRYGLELTVPELGGARFAGVSYTDFYEGFHAPLLTYEVGEGETGDFIYIFAFQNEDLAGQKQLDASARARQAIVAHDDVFIHTVEGHDVVSWQWDDVWYTAVS